jgi:nitrile hydratase subunit alpha
MSDEHVHDHGDAGHHHERPASPIELRARALEALLVEKGLVSTDAIDAVIELYENDIGPQNGAKVVARAWVDPSYRQRLLADGAAAIAELGCGGDEGSTVVVVPNEPGVHNSIVCTLCSCYPWTVLGLPPSWYKSAPYRARMVSEPAPSSESSASSCQPKPGSGSGIRARRCVTWCSLSGLPEPKVGTKKRLQRLSPAT